MKSTPRKIPNRTFVAHHPAGYGLVLSFLPGTGLEDVPPSLIESKAKTVLSESALKELEQLQIEIEKIRDILAQMPTTTVGEKYQRIELEVQLATLKAKKSLLLETPRNHVTYELAEQASHHYIKWLNSQFLSFQKSVVLNKKKDIGEYAKNAIDDPRYFGYSFENLIPLDERNEGIRSVNEKIENIYQNNIPRELRKYMGYSVKYKFLALPHAEYCLEEGVHCFDFGFNIFLAVEIEIKVLKEVTDVFYGYTMKIDFTGDTFGYVYECFEPDPPYSFWQTIPVKLVQGLLGAQFLIDGTAVLSSGGGGTAYYVEGMEVWIPDDFAEYLEEVNKKGGLAKVGIIDKKTAIVIDNLSFQQAYTADNVEMEGAIAKLMELGFTEEEVKNAAATIAFSPKITAEEIVEKVIKKLHTNNI